MQPNSTVDYADYLDFTAFKLPHLPAGRQGITEKQKILVLQSFRGIYLCSSV